MWTIRSTARLKAHTAPLVWRVSSTAQTGEIRKASEVYAVVKGCHAADQLSRLARVYNVMIDLV